MNAPKFLVVATMLALAPLVGCNQGPEQKATTIPASALPSTAGSSLPEIDVANKQVVGSLRRGSITAAIKVTPKNADETAQTSEVSGIRRFNAFIENEEQANSNPANLEKDRIYHLIAYMGERRQSGLLESERPNPALTKVLQGQSASRVSIVMDCEFCAPRERYQVRAISLPVDGESEHARFRFTPTRLTPSDKEDTLVMRIQQNGQIIQSFVAPVKVIPGSSPTKEHAAGASPGAAAKVATNPGDIVSLAAVAKESVASAVRLISADTESAQLPSEPDLTIRFDTSNRKIVFSGPVVRNMPGALESIVCDGVGEKDYEALATQVVDRLYFMRQRKAFRFDDTANETLRYVKLSNVSRRDVLAEFARLGNAMYRQLFASSPRALKILSALRRIPGSPRVYIESPNGYFPWALIYDGPASKLSPDSVDPEAFWGSRYILVGVPLDRTEQSPIVRELKFSDLSLLIGFYAGDETPFSTYRTVQRDYWLKPGRPAPIGESLSEDDLLTRLHEVAKAMTALYVYAHGQNGVQTVQARYRDSDQIVQFSRPDPAGAAIRLSPLRLGRSGLKPEDILALNIDEARLERALVFLNVCNGEATGAVSQRNFVPAFLSVGAGAVIATDSEMDQGVAAAFAQDFFDELASQSGDTTIAEIMFALRRKYLPHNPIVYAYTLWGNGLVKRDRDKPMERAK